MQDASGRLDGSDTSHSAGSLGEGEISLEEVERLSAQKTSQVIKESDEPKWRKAIREQMETELERRVRDALSTPPSEKLRERRDLAAHRRNMKQIEAVNARIFYNLSERERNFKTENWQDLQTQPKDNFIMTYFPSQNAQMEFIFRDELSKSNQDQFPGVFGLDNFSEGIKNIREDYTNMICRYAGSKPKARHFYTKEGFIKALQTGNLPAGVHYLDTCGRYVDKYGVIRDSDGPFWPMECVPLFPTPRFKWWTDLFREPLSFQLSESSRTIENQITSYNGRFRGTLVVYDSERSPREYSPQPVSEGCCPNLVFESRFESGNLRQARRIGQFEYELVLKTDLYTARHTQWYFFRVHNAQPDVTYKFRIVNLLKSDSLYNYGMRPLVYSEKDAVDKQRGWVRTGHHISYSRNSSNTSSPLLQRSITYYMLEWQMEFPNADDTYYMAHCYPYTFTDLKDDLDVLLANPDRKSFMRREVMCETRAGNSCFLITVTNFGNSGPKKAVVVSARVHPGESQASWMMKGLLEFITGPDPVAQELRERFVFKIIPMLNPDGVIVGNYRCSLAARDLNRNYRHPRRENFPTIHSAKAMVQDLAQKYEIVLYCDLHGHSRKHNVFMYGNNTSAEDDSLGVGGARAFISERLFPWLMYSKCPDKFSFRSCKFQIRRCKESTGRVVMWRQMNIYNSFTLEATFSGTVLNKEECRHFNILDLMEIGRNLAHVVLDYQHVQEDKLRQTEVVLQLTKAVTQQILESRGLLLPGTPLPDFTVDKNIMETDSEAVQENAEKWMEAMMTLLQQPAPQSGSNNIDEKNRRDERVKRVGVSTEQGGLSKEEVSKLLDRASLCTMDGCVSVLAALNVKEAVQESDSSDSDSESEPEMKPPEPRNRKKKRKSRRQRDKDRQKEKQEVQEKKGEEKDKEHRYKTLSTLPALLCAETANSSQGHAFSTGALSDSSFLTSAQLAKKQSKRREDAFSVQEPQRILAAEPKQFEILPEVKPETDIVWSFSGGFPGAGINMLNTIKSQNCQKLQGEPGVSVTSQFVKIAKGDGHPMFIPLRHIKHRKLQPVPVDALKGSHQSTAKKSPSLLSGRNVDFKDISVYHVKNMLTSDQSPSTSKCSDYNSIASLPHSIIQGYKDSVCQSLQDLSYNGNKDTTSKSLLPPQSDGFDDSVLPKSLRKSKSCTVPLETYQSEHLNQRTGLNSTPGAQHRNTLLKKGSRIRLANIQTGDHDQAESIPKYRPN